MTIRTLALLVALTLPPNLVAAQQGALEQDYPSAIRPLLKRYCHECHTGDDAEAEIDLASFATTTDVRRQIKVWLKVRTMLESRQMPPKDADQPTDSERAQMQKWVRNFLTVEAKAHAGDPGPVVLRRLSNAEYTYTIRDLTGVDSLDPTHEFPVDGAAGEGFTNAGSAQGMSPALVQKYLDAAKQVAAHAVLLPDGIRFSPYTSQRDRTDKLLARIQAFYRRFTADGGGSAVNLQGIKFSTNQGGLLPLESYLAATLAEREALTSGQKTIDAVARERSLNERYLATLWKTLAADSTNQPSLLIGQLREKWRQTKAAEAPALAAEIDKTRKALWKFNSIGHIGRQGGPKSWMEAVTPIVSQQPFKVNLPAAPGGEDVVVYLAAGDAGDGNEADYVTWKNPRLEGGGRPPLLLRDAAGLAQRLADRRQKMLSRSAKYLAAAAEVKPDSDVAEVASRYDVDKGLLKVWLNYLAIGSGDPVEVQGHFTNKMEKGGNYDFIKGWGTPQTPAVSANSSDQQVRIPGIAKPHSLVAHPSPTLFAAVGWYSPISGTVRVEAHVADAHPECGNGVEFFVQHRTSASTGTLWQGDFGIRGTATMPPQTISVRKGELVSFILGPRQGNHSCDLTEFNLVISETTGPKRVWDLAKEVSGDILAGNPHADGHGHKDTWHFYKGEMAKVKVGPGQPASVPAGSVLDLWLAEKDAARRAVLADRVQSLATGKAPADANSPDALLYRQLQSLAVPADQEELSKDLPPDDRFGKHPLGHAMDAADLVVKAPSVVEIRIPAALAAGRELLVTGQLESQHGREGSVQLQVATQKPDQLSLPISNPILVAAGSTSHNRVEKTLSDFRNLFPAALCYARIVPVDEVVTLTLFYREDDHLKRLMLTDAQAAELDRLWDELFYVSQEPLKLVVAFEQISEFATQDRPDLVKAFAPLRKTIADRAAAFSERMITTEPAHVRAVVQLAERAWRRPLTAAEQRKLHDLYGRLRDSEIPHEEAIHLTLARALTSPAFLYKLEKPAAGKEAAPVTDLELATRLSYFLWSSLPDGPLRSAAESGKLTDEEEPIAQTRRMLKDPRTRRLAIQFACQWLHLRDFDKNDDKNEKLYPEFAALRGDMYEETVRFFENMFRGDGSILGLLDADHSFLNESMARHYGIAGVTGSDWRRIEGVRAKQRGGVLGMATLLASQSGASRTSPILRGNWVYETLLGERLPRPPPGVPQLPDAVPSGLTARQLIERHSSDAACAKCHLKIDPYGFALEQYDAIGRLRPQKVDTKTTLAGGKTIEGIDGLREYLTKDRRDDVVRQFCRKLLGYALGREIQLSDEPLLERMMTELAANNFRFSVAAEAIVGSSQFRKIRGAAHN